MIPDHRTPVVTQMIWYKVGSADETPGKSGLAHFLEHLMFKGTAKHPAGEFSQTVLRIGGNENAFTSLDYTGYFQRVPREHLAKMMEFEADRMTGLILKDENVLPERDVVLEEFNMRVANNPDARLTEQIMAALYLNHPYGRPIIGWRQEIEKLDREDALAFYKRFYAPNNAILVIAGDVDAKEVRPMVEKAYGGIPAQPAISAHRIRPQEPVPAAPRTVTLSDPRVEQTSLRRYYLVPSSTTAAAGEGPALDVLAQLMGGGSNSYLYRALVIDRPLAVSAGAGYQGTSLDPSQFSISVSPKPGVEFSQVEQAIDGVIADVIQNPARAEDLERVKTQLIAEAIYAQDNQATLARWYGGALTTGLSIDDIRSWPDRIRAVTAEQVRDAAQKWLDKKPLGDRLSDQGCRAETRGEALVIRLSIGAQRLASSLIAGAVLLSLAATPSHAAAKIQRLVSPGGIEAWFVQDATVPLIAMEYAFGGGAAQDPIGQTRRRQHGRRPARRGLRRSRFQDLSRAPRAPRHRTELLVDPGYFPRLAPHAQGQQGRGLRPPAAGADLAAFRRHRRRAHSRAGALRIAPRHHQPDLAGEPQIPRSRLRRSSLWQAGQRHARQRAEDRRRRHEGLRSPRDRQGYACASPWSAMSMPTRSASSWTRRSADCRPRPA